MMSAFRFTLLRGPKRSHSPGGSLGLWAVRLFILPHTLIGLFFLLMMVVVPIWVLAGRDAQRPISRVWETRDDDGDPVYNMAIKADATGRETAKRTIPREAFNRLSRAILDSPEADVMVTVRRLGVGRLAFERPMLPGESGWGQVAFFWGFGLFWNAVLSIFVYALYWAPFREWRRRRREDATLAYVPRKVLK